MSTGMSVVLYIYVYCEEHPALFEVILPRMSASLWECSLEMATIPTAPRLPGWDHQGGQFLSCLIHNCLMPCTLILDCSLLFPTCTRILLQKWSSIPLAEYQTNIRFKILFVNGILEKILLVRTLY
jgi:hypothetical protein